MATDYTTRATTMYVSKTHVFGETKEGNRTLQVQYPNWSISKLSYAYFEILSIGLRFLATLLLFAKAATPRSH